MSVCTAETPLPRDPVGQILLHDRNIPFDFVFSSFAAGFRSSNKSSFAYLEKLFADRWEDLFTPEFAHRTQSEPDTISNNDEEVYAQVNGMIEETAIMRLFCDAALKWALPRAQQCNVLSNEAMLGQYLTNMPSALKKELLSVQQKNILWGNDNKTDAYLRHSRYAFYAMLANTMLFHDQCELFTQFDTQCKQIQRANRMSKEERAKKLALISQLQELLYESLGEGQRYRIALYFDLKKKCDNAHYNGAGPCKLQRFRSVDAGDNAFRDALTPAAENRLFLPPAICAQTLEREHIGGQTVSMSYRTILNKLCPDVMKALQHDSQLCSSFFTANVQHCTGSIGLSPRGPNTIQQRDSGQFSTVPSSSHEHAALERIFDETAELSVDVQAALRAPYLHKTPLNAKDLQKKWPQEIDRLSRLNRKYPENRLVAAHAAKEAQTVGVQLLCNEKDVPADIQRLILQFLFPQWGLYVRSCPGDSGRVYIASDGVRDLLLDHHKALSTRKISTCERMQPSDVFRLFSSYYDPAHKRATIIVPNS